jgi:hypothetical protein
MAHGFTILRGEANGPLDAPLLDAVSEIRVEQELSKATKFAIRFEEDLCEGQPTALSARALKPGELMTVLVPDEAHKDVCLVRGPITRLKSSSVVGGPGSWLEVHGEDRRIEMERASISAVWTGAATDIATSILSTYGFEIDVAAGGATGGDSLSFGDGARTLNQSAPDLKLIEDLGRQLGYEFWLDYVVEAAPLPGGDYSVTETARFKPSPDYGAAGGALGGLLSKAIDMIGGGAGAKTLKLNIADGQCRNLTAFDLDVDVERATMAVVGGTDDRSGKEDDDKAEDEQSPTDQGGTVLKSFGTAQRTINPPGAGSAAERATETRAALADEGWFITAKASTSVFMLPGILAPHAIVKVEGAGFAHSGNYQVSKVLHVVNAWGHLMDLTLRRNALPEGAYG